MTIEELYKTAKALDLLDESVGEVVNYINQLGTDTLNRGVCCACAIRKTDKCPWQGQNGLMMPACISFRPRVKAMEVLPTTK